MAVGEIQIVSGMEKEMSEGSSLLTRERKGKSLEACAWKTRATTKGYTDHRAY